jgi:alkylation response protein AidB-like acyl-CoA dehydrogenase
MSTTRRRFNFTRELLLTEIARRCRGCDVPARLGLTKAEARDYTGFECEACELWNDDELFERDIPEWWEELRVTGLDALRPSVDADGRGGVDESESVARLSEAWRVEARDGDDNDAATEEESL